MASGIFEIMIFLLLGQGSPDLVSLVDLDSYFIEHQLATSPDGLAGILRSESVKGLNELVGQLGDDDYKVRESAQKKILALGPSVVDALESMERPGDLEVRDRIGQIVDALRPKRQLATLHRLMVLRRIARDRIEATRSVVEALHQETSDRWEREYAGQALAALDGKEWKPRVPTLSADAARAVLGWLSPPECSLLVRADFTDSAENADTSIEGLLGEVFQEQMSEQDRKKMKRKLQEAIVQALTTIGNIRLHRGLLAVDLDGEQGALWIQADHDSKRLIAALEEQGQTSRTVGDRTIYMLDRRSHLIPISDDSLVINFGRKDPAELLRRLTRDATFPSQAPEFASQLFAPGVAEAGFVAAMRFTQNLNRELELDSVPPKFVRGIGFLELHGPFSFEATIEMEDAEAATALEAFLVEGLATMQKQLEKEAARVPMAAKLQKLLSGVRIVVKDRQVIGRYAGEAISGREVMSLLMGSFLFARSSPRAQRPARVRPPPAPVRPPVAPAPPRIRRVVPPKVEEKKAPAPK